MLLHKALHAPGAFVVLIPAGREALRARRERRGHRRAQRSLLIGRPIGGNELGNPVLVRSGGGALGEMRREPVAPQLLSQPQRSPPSRRAVLCGEQLGLPHVLVGGGLGGLGGLGSLGILGIMGDEQREHHGELEPVGGEHDARHLLRRSERNASEMLVQMSGGARP
eukprot:1189265-Prorocentrum_minimum.AAC.4